MDSKEYVSLLEQSLVTHPDAPAMAIRNWDGSGNLPYDDYAKGQDDEVDNIVKLVLDGEDPERDAKLAGIGEGKTRLSRKGISPISMLEAEVQEARVDPRLLGEEITPDNDFGDDEHGGDDEISESIRFESKESSILSRLITEMDAIAADNTGITDDYMDDTTAVPEPEFSEDDLETQSGYEMD